MECADVLVLNKMDTLDASNQEVLTAVRKKQTTNSVTCYNWCAADSSQACFDRGLHSRQYRRGITIKVKVKEFGE